MKRWLSSLFGAAAALLAVSAHAQEASAPVSPSTATDAIEPQWRVRDDVENDSMGPWKSDRDYTSGVRVTVDRQSPDGKGHWQASVGQNIYTPPLHVDPAQPQRVNAAVAYITLARIQSDMNHTQGVQATVGVTGPAAMGEEVQNGLHEAMGNPVRDWSQQIDKGMVANVAYARSDVLAAGQIADSFPYRIALNNEIGTGSMATYLRTGLLVQVGTHIDGDIPAITNSTPSPRLRFAESAVAPQTSCSLFAAANMRVMADDWTIDDTPSSTRSLRREIFVPEVAAGIQMTKSRVTGEIAVAYTGREYETQEQAQAVMRVGLSYRFG
mgnify:CR=1 FL=1